MKTWKLVVIIALLLVVFTGCSESIDELGNRQLTVTFDDQDADTSVDPASKKVLNIIGANKVGSLPTSPQKTGASFGGWYTQTNGGGTEFNASTPVTGDITVYAK